MTCWAADSKYAFHGCHPASARPGGRGLHAASPGIQGAPDRRRPRDAPPQHRPGQTNCSPERNRATTTSRATPSLSINIRSQWHAYSQMTTTARNFASVHRIAEHTAHVIIASCGAGGFGLAAAIRRASPSARVTPEGTVRPQSALDGEAARLDASLPAPAPPGTGQCRRREAGGGSARTSSFSATLSGRPQVKGKMSVRSTFRSGRAGAGRPFRLTREFR